MLVVSDTTPLISFLKIKRLDMLQQLFETVVIPHAVYRELTCNEDFVDEIQQIREKSFILVDESIAVDAVNQLQLETGLEYVDVKNRGIAWLGLTPWAVNGRHLRKSLRLRRIKSRVRERW